MFGFTVGWLLWCPNISGGSLKYYHRFLTVLGVSVVVVAAAVVHAVIAVLVCCWICRHDPQFLRVCRKSYIAVHICILRRIIKLKSGIAKRQFFLQSDYNVHGNYSTVTVAPPVEYSSI